MARDFYGELGVSKSASPEEIKEAYKKLAKQFHPDVNKDKDAEEKFKKIGEAYRVLSDPQKRQQYDQFGENAERFGGQGGFSGFEGFSGQDFDFSDLFDNMGFGGSFSDFFSGGGRQTQRSRRGQDILVNLTISFEEAAFGVTKEIFVNKTEKCSKCSGEGTTEKDGKQTCTTCHGSGIQKTMQRTILGTIATQTTCGKCKGVGKIITKPCTTCHGSGKESVRKKISVKIPAGVENGIRLRVNGEGNAGDNGAQSGDLFVGLFVEEHEFFKRDGSDVYLELPITFSQAALGTKAEVPTVHGKVELKIPAATQSGTVFRLKEQGVKSLNSSRIGDQFVKVIVKTPDKLSKKQKDLLEELAKEEGTHKKGKKGFFSF